MATSELFVFTDGYTPVGDVLVLASVIIFAVLIKAVYIKPNREFRIFQTILGLLFAAAVTNIIYNLLLVEIETSSHFFVYLLRACYHIFLFGSLVLYILYMEIPLQLSQEKEQFFFKISAFLMTLFVLVDIGGTAIRHGFYITESNTVHKGSGWLFVVEYLIFSGILIFILINYSDRIFKPLIFAFITTCAVSMSVMMIQAFFGQHSFTTATFVFPAYAVLYLLHANPFDPEMGSLHSDAFDERLRHSIMRGDSVIMMSLYMREFDEPGRKYPKEMRDTIRDAATNYLKEAVLFQISGGRMILMAEMMHNPDYEHKVKRLLELFEENYNIYRQDYKLVIIETTDKIKEPDVYLKLIEYVERRIPNNTVKYAKEDDIEKFYGHQYIVDELEDINLKRDFFDNRVIVYCQPVYNLRKERFDTAEALMRLKLDKTGMVYPDRFIPIAEKHNYIHTLSMIILAQTCRQIRQLLDDGYEVDRISVNFSIMDVREKDFCKDVKDIITRCEIPFNKVAIEITESQNESDFMAVKEKLLELKKSGITFYLDDFGTGYSNFERIMELPFDIIKFDRSLVVASKSDCKSETMVSYMAHMFTDMNYAVLYEGIEDDRDEMLCRKMYARYLQGYKYSKPIPIENLRDFLVKTDE